MEQDVGFKQDVLWNFTEDSPVPPPPFPEIPSLRIASRRPLKETAASRRRERFPPLPLEARKWNPGLSLSNIFPSPPPSFTLPPGDFFQGSKELFFSRSPDQGGLFFCGFLCLRLIVSEGGVLDYAAQRTLWESRSKKHESILSGNKRVAGEIDKIKKDTQYQKRLVRDHLGFIAPDEYLVLFAKEKRKTSTSRSSPP